MDRVLKRLAARVYSGCAPLGERDASPFLAGMDVRFFSYGRHALREALLLAGVGQGDVVLFPEYICRETLAAAHTLGATIAYYPVDRALRLAVSPESLPAARVVVAVDYFGFPQDMGPFEAYCRQHGAVLIEDNAHGFLSRDGEGAPLGTRGDIGVFSFRKSVSMINGSGMVVNRSGKVGEPGAQLAFLHYETPPLFRIKGWLRRLAAWHMTGLLYRLIGIERRMRARRTGSAIVASGSTSERQMPGPAEPDARTPDILRRLDAVCEIARRRQLYAAVRDFVVAHGGEPVFLALPDGVAPYGFPFHASTEAYRRINAALNEHYLDSYPWPELPGEIQERIDAFYHSIYLVNFIW